jgi:hypothetical protein
MRNGGGGTQQGWRLGLILGFEPIKLIQVRIGHLESKKKKKKKLKKKEKRRRCKSFPGRVMGRVSNHHEIRVGSAYG